MIYIIIGWVLFGLFYLLYGVFIDMYYFFKILQDYKMQEDQDAIRAAVEEKTDHIIIYNEIIDTLQSLYFLCAIAERDMSNEQRVIKGKKPLPKLSLNANMSLSEAL